MNYYLDVTLLPDSEISLYFLWEKIYSALHFGLVKMKNEEGNSLIGFAFPEYKPRFLGTKLRLFAENKALLEKFDVPHCLKNFSDYVHIRKVRVVPEKIEVYACYQRIQIKSNVERLMRRSVSKGKLTLKQAENKLKVLDNNQTDLPYIQIRSRSTGEKFLLFIHYSEKNRTNTQIFSTYGLSKQSTVPVF